MGSLLLCAGTKGMRFALPNARIMVHQPSGGFSGQASDIERHAEDIIKMKRRLNEVYVKHTGQTYEVIERTLDRDYFMTADQAKEFGLIDKVLIEPGRSRFRRHRRQKRVQTRMKPKGRSLVPPLASRGPAGSSSSGAAVELASWLSAESQPTVQVATKLW